jgi:hypothetical protein
MRTGKQTEKLKQEGWIGAADISRLTGWALPTIHRWIGDGKIPGRRIGIGWFVDVHRFLPLLESEWNFPKSSEIYRGVEAIAKKVPPVKPSARQPVSVK